MFSKVNLFYNFSEQNFYIKKPIKRWAVDLLNILIIIFLQNI